MNDIRFFWSLMCRSPTDETDEDIKALQHLRWVWCTRKLASVICEADDSLGTMIGKLKNRVKLDDVPPRISKQNNKSPFKELATKLRNKSTYHYISTDMAAELKTFNAEDRHRIFAHAQRGNIISEPGEQVFTLPLIHSHGHTTENSALDKWIMQTSASIMKYCENVSVKILKSAFPAKKYQKRKLVIQNEAADLSHRWPLFIVRHDKVTPS